MLPFLWQGKPHICSIGPPLLISLKIAQSLLPHITPTFFCHMGQPLLNHGREPSLNMLYINFYSLHLISSHFGKKTRREFCTCWNFQKCIYSM